MNIKHQFRRQKIQATLIILILLFYGLILLPKDLFNSLTSEDGFFENITAICFLIASVTFLLLFINGRYLKSHNLIEKFSSRSRRYVFLLLALVFFFGFGEEISWGQRIIGFSTPEAFAENNAQNEFNIHNLELFNIRNVDGERKGTLGKLFTMKQLFLYAFFCFLFVIPVLNKRSPASRKLLSRCFIPIAPLWLGVLFVFNYVIYRVLRIFTDSSSDIFFSEGLTEMQEFNFSIILLFVPFTWMLVSKQISQQELRNPL